MNIREFKDKINLELPASYLTVLNSEEEIKVDLENKRWKLFSLKEVTREIVFSGTQTFNYELMKAHIYEIKDHDLSMNALQSPLSLDELGRCITIGEENADLLLLDKDFNVWAFFHSSLEVAKLADSFDDLLTHKERRSFKEVNPPLELDGDWIPIESETNDISFIKKVYPLFTFEGNGTGKKRKKDVFKWKFIENNRDGRDCILIDDDQKIFISDFTDETFIYSNEDNNLRILYKRLNLSK
jgi:hypothetical protein